MGKTRGTGMKTRSAQLSKSAARLCRVVVLGAVFVTIGCSPIYRNHGWVPTTEDLASVDVGVDTRLSVEETLGAPSSGGVLGDGNFYYVRSRFRTSGMTRSRVISRDIVAVTFTDAGVVRNIAQLSLEDGNVIAFETRVTDPAVNNNTFLRQLLSGGGRFSPATGGNQI